MNLSNSLLKKVSVFHENIRKLGFWKEIRAIGFWQAINYRVVRQPLPFILAKLGFDIKHRYFPLYVKNYAHPIWFRYGASDLCLFEQFFFKQEYAFLENLEDAKFIIDCGANVGYSSIYFLNRYPTAHLIAVEPDDDNFKVCQKNFLKYSGRVSLVRSAIWSHEVGLIVCKGQYKDGLEWSTQVQECQRDQEPDIYATGISTLLDKSGFKRIDILKIDVERAEIEIFARNYDWLNKVKNIVIELHDEECERIFFQALSMYEYDLSSSGDLTICKSISSKTQCYSQLQKFRL